jgi:mRNA-degrading endonuclease RelE of RelBE toxin-antitoxin system
MIFKIEFSSKAYKYLKKLDSVTKTRIINQLQILSENPRRQEELDRS